MKIRYTNKALAQLEQICSYVESHDPRAAETVKRRIVQSIARLARFPYSARETTLPGVRVLPITRYPYLVFYKVDDAAHEVHILRIRHSSQDPARHLD